LRRFGERSLTVFTALGVTTGIWITFAVLGFGYFVFQFVTSRQPELGGLGAEPNHFVAAVGLAKLE